MNEKRQNKSVIIWLAIGCVLIFLMVLIGGITRLTHSGLSMVDWRPIMGTIPPMNQMEWERVFEMYKSSPEYKQVNFTMDLSAFKGIFFWEYLHRLIGRLVGIVFIIPFVFFLIKKQITGSLIHKLLLVLFLGGLQGVVGWWMVKSGLVNDPDVSHYRLAVHLTLAFITCAYTFWLLLEIYFKDRLYAYFPHMRKWFVALLVGVLVQIVYGAFVAGLNAGFTANTWPTIDGEWFPESVYAMSPVWLNFVEGILGVQFVHRTLGIGIVIFMSIIFFKVRKLQLAPVQSRAILLVMYAIVIQVLLGIFTLICRVPISLGVLHQLGAFFLLLTVVNALFHFNKQY